MPRFLFVDTSGWLAAFSAAETEHDTVKEALEEAVTRRAVVTSDYIVDEALTLFQVRRGHARAMQFGETVWRRGGADVLEVDASIREAAWTLFSKFGDQGLSFTDCTTAALMRRQNLDDILTLDRRFDLFGLNRLPR